MNKLSYAQKFISQEIAVLPLGHRSKDPEIKFTNGTTNQFFATIPSSDEVTRWLFSNWQNYGVVCGWGNLVVIDFDHMDYFNLWKMWAQGQTQIIRYAVEASFKVKTRRGVHVYISTLEPMQNEKRIAKSGGIDVIAQNKYVVGAMSTHPSGHVYEPMSDDFIFPNVMDIDDILPVELFPRLVSEPETGSMNPVAFVPTVTTTNTEYDAFELASSSFQGLDLITKVKSRVRIEALFADVRRSSTDGRWYAARCTFHDDGKASAWIDVKRQLFGCEVCKMKPMDAINLYARMHNLSESVAVSALAREVGIL